jgi:hypothetical protein
MTTQRYKVHHIEVQHGEVIAFDVRVDRPLGYRVDLDGKLILVMLQHGREQRRPTHSCRFYVLDPGFPVEVPTEELRYEGMFTITRRTLKREVHLFTHMTLVEDKPAEERE